MMKIRLARRGTKGVPHYKIVVTEALSPRDGRFKEVLGRYHPLTSPDVQDRIVINAERLQYWLSVGAHPTDRVARLMALRGLGQKPALRTQTKQDKPKAKAQERANAAAAEATKDSAAA